MYGVFRLPLGFSLGDRHLNRHIKRVLRFGPFDTFAYIEQFKRKNFKFYVPNALKENKARFLEVVREQPELFTRRLV